MRDADARHRRLSRRMAARPAASEQELRAMVGGDARRICAGAYGRRCRNRSSNRWRRSICSLPPTRTRAIETARLFTAYLLACRQEHRDAEPGRARPFPDARRPRRLAGAHLCTAQYFRRRRTARRFQLGDDASAATTPIRDVVVRPFFRDHFARLDRQIVLVDALSALPAGPRRCATCRTRSRRCWNASAWGRGGWLDALFSPSADRILFAATKADLLHHAAHDRLEAFLKRLTEAAIARAGDADAAVDVIALAAVRATREAMVKGEGGELPAIVGTAVPGEWERRPAFRRQDRDRAFPGDLPESRRTLQGGDLPLDPFSPAPTRGDRRRHAGLPHIRLDRALQFLIGDRLR